MRGKYDTVSTIKGLMEEAQKTPVDEEEFPNSRRII